MYCDPRYFLCILSPSLRSEYGQLVVPVSLGFQHFFKSVNLSRRDSDTNEMRELVTCPISTASDVVLVTFVGKADAGGSIATAVAG